MRVVEAFTLLGLVSSSSSCDRQTAPPSSIDPRQASKRSDAAVADASRPIATADASTAATSFIRVRPAFYELKSVDACAYVGGMGFSCIDALVQEPDPVRVRYMRRLSDAYARLNRDQDLGAPAHAELSDCCNEAGSCGATKRKTGHTDCPKMDDGYACLTAAELRVSGKPKQDPRVLHERACHCDWQRAQIPVMGGLLACDGLDKPVKRGSSMEEREAREVTACGVCDPADGPTSCASEIARLKPRDQELAHYIESIHITRCELP